MLNADFTFQLSQRLEEIVANGVPLYFRVEFELTRPLLARRKGRSRRLQLRLSYHALSRLSLSAACSRRISPPSGSAERAQAHAQLAGRGSTTFSDATQAAVRLRLDTGMLPRPFQLSALTSRELQLEASWKRFTVRPAQTPAPVESRNPQGAR